MTINNGTITPKKSVGGSLANSVVRTTAYPCFAEDDIDSLVIEFVKVDVENRNNLCLSMQKLNIILLMHTNLIKFQI